MQTKPYPLFVKRDLDGFFGLFIDNMVQLLAIAGFCGMMCGMTGDDSRFVYKHILPGAAVSILFGNLFYAWQAHRLARREGRNDVTALPYGINTPSMIVYVMFVMKPVYDRTQDAELAWQMGLIACLGSGIIEFCGAFVANTIRRHTPRAALLSTLAGIAIGFISMSFALQIFQRPLVAMLPLALILITLFSRVPFPLGLPGGLIAVVAGTAIAWLLTVFQALFPGLPGWVTASAMEPAAIQQAVNDSSMCVPQLAIDDIQMLLTQQQDSVWGFLTIIIPMGLFNLIGSLQNIESAEAGGDSYDTRSSLAVNGLGTIVAACFGSCFPTTIYIGHPGWKALGARAGYSTLNGLVITLLCLFGVVGVINSIVPIESGIAIVLWIGIVITAQAFQATPNQHAPAVAMGLFPAIAAWGTTVMMGSFIASGGKTIQQLLSSDLGSQVGGFLIHGMVVMERGYIFTCMILAAVSAFLIDRRFYAASAWSLAGGVFSMLGLIHAYQVSGNEVDYLFRFTTSTGDSALKLPANGIAIGYLSFSIVFLLFALYSKPSAAGESESADGH